MVQRQGERRGLLRHRPQSGPEAAFSAGKASTLRGSPRRGGLRYGTQQSGRNLTFLARRVLKLLGDELEAASVDWWFCGFGCGFFCC